jgi:CO dehydrogenase/acetyl-CoA synthase alpha subunit
VSLSAVFKDFPGLFAGIATPQAPQETERQADQRIADELRARNLAATCPGCKETLGGELVCCDPDAAAFHQLGSDAE